MRSPRTATKGSPCSPQLEKAHAQQRRPDAAKNKYKNKINKFFLKVLIVSPKNTCCDFDDKFTFIIGRRSSTLWTFSRASLTSNNPLGLLALKKGKTERWQLKLIQKLIINYALTFNLNKSSLITSGSIFKMVDHNQSFEIMGWFNLMSIGLQMRIKETRQQSV